MNRKCNRCNVIIKDDAVECPLCHGVLENASDTESKSLTYPDVSTSLRKMQFIIRLVIFASIIAEITVIIINYFTFKGVYWSVLIGVELVYGCFVLAYSFQKRRSLQRLVQVQMYAAIIILILTDYLIGYSGWSFTFAIPITLMAVDAGMIVLMIVGLDGWQSYIMTEIVTFILSVILLVVASQGVIRMSFIQVIACLVTGLSMIGTILLGGKMISNEIKRRFRV